MVLKNGGRTVLDRVKLAVCRALLRAAAWLPLRFMHMLAHVGWWGAVLFKTREYRVAKKNIALCFPGLTETKRRELLKKNLLETTKGILELPYVWGRSPRRVLAAVKEVVGAELLAGALEDGQGAIVAAPHLGSWEMLNLYIGSLAGFTVLYRAPEKPWLEQLLLACRTRTGVAALRADRAAPRALLARLREGGCIGILPDQRPKKGEGQASELFGHPIHTMSLLPRLREKTGARVVFAFAERLPRARGFKIHFLQGEGLPPQAPLAEAVLAMNRGIARCVARAPEQYQWTYKMFGMRGPEGPDPVYGKWKRSRHAKKHSR